MGDLPEVGEWVRLEVSAAEVGLEDKDVSGMAFTLHGGRATWDRAGIRRSAVKLREFYGYGEDTVEGGTWQQHLAQVPEFLRRTELQYTDLLELLKTRFVNPDPTSATAVTLDPHGGDCDLGVMTISNLAANDNAALKKIHRFIRLWHKLGGPMGDLDATLSELGTGDTDEAFLRRLADARRLQADLKMPLVQLLSLWAEKLDTRGDDSVYHALFQNKAVLYPLDRAFDLRPDRTQLASTISKVTDKIPAILAALRLNAAELAAVREDAKIGDDAALNLENLSKLYRYALLARVLNLPIKDLISLKKLAGIAPFWPNGPEATVAFVRTMHKVQQSGFTVAQLNYLYRHLSEPADGIAPLNEQLTLLVKDLQDGLRKVIEDTTVIPDPSGELLRSKLASVLDSDVIGVAMSIIDGSSEATNTEKRDFIDHHFASFLDTSEAKTLLLAPLVSILAADTPSAQAQKREERERQRQTRLAYVLKSVMTHLRDALSRSLVKQRLSDALSLDSAMTELLLDKVLKARTDAGKPAMTDFLALVGDGLSATYFDSMDLTDPPKVRRIDPTINFGWGMGSPDPAIGPETFSARWTGKILPQYSEAYTFYARTDDGVRLWVNDQLMIDEWRDQAPTEHSGTITLEAGRLYDIKMEYYDNSGNATAELHWSSTSSPKLIIPQSQLYSLQSYYLLHKLALLINTFKMTAEEVSYLSAHGGNFANLDFNALPVDSSGFTIALFDQWERLYDLFALRDSLPHGEVGLIDVFRTANSAGASVSGMLDKLAAALDLTTTWDRAELGYLSGPGGFNLTVDAFKSEVKLQLLQDCLALCRRLGVSTRQLFAWARGGPDESQAREIVNTIKAKYDDEQWLAVGQPVNDKLRERQKTALISYVLADKDILSQGVTDSNELSKYFLIDVDMSACMKTSRIKQAISSVQLFIQRCQMNLESQVAPSAIDDPDRWKWIKNYRVWEANRKVFLYPENWIEPELRDDKSPFFKELETELLQSEVTADTVETALLNYLDKLDDVARLEICGMYRYQEDTNTQDTTDVLHVFGRTFASPHRYYYRTFIDGSTWTPWEKVNLDIEGDHLIPVVYNRRRYLFWPIFERKADPIDDKLVPPAKEPIEYWQIKLAWSEYKNGKWAPKKVSSDYLEYPEKHLDAGELPGKETYTFKAQVDADGLCILCYGLKEV